jgi:hypothetical protein
MGLDQDWGRVGRSEMGVGADCDSGVEVDGDCCNGFDDDDGDGDGDGEGDDDDVDDDANADADDDVDDVDDKGDGDRASHSW